MTPMNPQTVDPRYLADPEIMKQLKDSGMLTEAVDRSESQSLSQSSPQPQPQRLNPETDLLCRIIAHELVGVNLYNALACLVTGKSSLSIADLCNSRCADLIRSVKDCYTYLLLLNGEPGYSMCTLTPCTLYIDKLRSGITTDDQCLTLLLDWNKSGHQMSSQLGQFYNQSFPEIAQFFFSLSGRYLSGIHEIQIMLS